MQAKQKPNPIYVKILFQSGNTERLKAMFESHGSFESNFPQELPKT